MVATNSSSSGSNCWRRTTRRQYESSSQSSIGEEDRYIEMNYEGGDRKCYCGLKAPRFTAWKTDDNPGRRYFGCPNWTWRENARVHHCRFFEWFDEKFCDRAVEVIRKLRDRHNACREQRDAYKKERDFLKADRDDLVEEREALMAELMWVRGIEENRATENKRLTATITMMEEKLKKLEAWFRILISLSVLLGLLGFAFGELFMSSLLWEV